jgi:hypothetical protein
VGRKVFEGVAAVATKCLLLAADSDETSAFITFGLVWAAALADDFLFRFFFAVGAAA